LIGVFTSFVQHNGKRQFNCAINKQVKYDLHVQTKHHGTHTKT